MEPNFFQGFRIAIVIDKVSLSLRSKLNAISPEGGNVSLTLTRSKMNLLRKFIAVGEMSRFKTR
jgi:hypothetical protein